MAARLSPGATGRFALLELLLWVSLYSAYLAIRGFTISDPDRAELSFYAQVLGFQSDHRHHYFVDSIAGASAALAAVAAVALHRAAARAPCLRP